MVRTVTPKRSAKVSAVTPVRRPRRYSAKAKRRSVLCIATNPDILLTDGFGNLAGMNAVGRRTGSGIEPLRLAAPEATVAGLRHSLGRRVRTEGALATCLAHGASWPALCDLAHYLGAGFELKHQALFELSCFRASLGDARLCFIHELSSERSALPLLLLHGSHASFAEFQAQVRALTEGASE